MRNCSLVFLALAGVIGVYDLYLRNHAGVPRESEVERIKLINGIAHAGFCVRRATPYRPLPVYPTLAYWLQHS